MYKHIADSILESNDKRFISQIDKDKYDNYENIFVSKDDTYSKEEMDTHINQLQPSFIQFSCVGETVLDNTKSGSVKDLIIEARTIRDIENKSLSDNSKIVIKTSCVDKESTTSIELPCSFDGVGDGKDTLTKKDNVTYKLEKRTHKVVLNDYIDRLVIHTVPGNDQYIRAFVQTDRLNLPTPKYENCDIVCNKLGRMSANNWQNNAAVEGIYCGAVSIGISINIGDKHRDESIVNYIKSLNIEFVYPIMETEVIELDLTSDDVLTFNGDTHISIETSDCLVKGEAPISIGASIESTNDIITNVNDRLQSVNKLNEGTSIKYDTKERRTILKDSKNGVIEDMKIEGLTLVNIHDSNQTYNLRVSSDDEDKCVAENGPGYCKATISEQISNWVYITAGLAPKTLKNNTKYTIYFEEYNRVHSVLFSSGNMRTRLSDLGRIRGNKALVTTTEDCEEKLKGADLIYTYVCPSYSPGTVKVSKCVIIEGDHTDKDISFFEGLKSVNDENDTLEIYSKNETKNLLNIQDLHNGTNTVVRDGMVRFRNTDGEFNISNFAFIPVEKGCKYRIKITNVETLNKSHYGILAIRDGDKSSDQSTEFVSMKDYANYRVYEVTPKHDLIRLYLTTENQKTVGTFTYKISLTKVEDFCDEYEIDKKEVVMVKDLVNIYDGKYEQGDMNWSNGTDENNDLRSRSGYIDIEGKVTLKFNFEPTRVIFYDKDKKFISAENLKSIYAVPKNSKYIRFSVIDSKYDITNMRLQAFSHISLKSTQNVKDTIEKHSDGKWYYHKRCGKVTITGEDIVKQTDNYTSADYLCCSTDYIPTLADKSGSISDRFTDIVATDKDIEAFWVGYVINQAAQQMCFRFKKKKSGLSSPDLAGFKSWANSNPITIVYELKVEEVYEVTPLDLMSFEGETLVGSNMSVVVGGTSFSVSSYIGNTINSLKNKVSSIENIMSQQNISQNKFILMNSYVADKTSLKVDIATMRTMSYEVNEDLFTLIYKNIIVGENNYDRYEMEEIIDFYTMIGYIDYDMAGILFELIEKQHEEII